MHGASHVGVSASDITRLPFITANDIGSNTPGREPLPGTWNMTRVRIEQAREEVRKEGLRQGHTESLAEV